MYNGKSFLGIIPARGDSKDIPNKNIVLINNKPLIQYTIDEAIASKYLDDIIVSTDSKDIANISRELGASVPYLRPKKLATDEAKTIDTIIHVIEEEEKLGRKFDYVVTLQPTQPLRKQWHIDEAIEKTVKEKLEGIVSVSKVNEHPILMRTMDTYGHLENLMDANSTVRRQDFPAVYKVNGAIYINEISSVSKGISLNDNKSSYIMANEYDLDIDNLYDLDLFRWFLKK